MEIDVVGNRIPFFFFPFYVSIHCAGSSLLHTGFSLVGAGGGSSSLWCMAFSLQWLLLLPSTGSRVHRLPVVAARGLSRFSCGPWGTGPVDLVKGL